MRTFLPVQSRPILALSCLLLASSLPSVHAATMPAFDEEYGYTILDAQTMPPEAISLTFNSELQTATLDADGRVEPAKSLLTPSADRFIKQHPFNELGLLPSNMEQHAYVVDIRDFFPDATGGGTPFQLEINPQNNTQIGTLASSMAYLIIPGMMGFIGVRRFYSH